MDINKLDRLTSEFGPVKWFPQSILDLPNEGWFLLELTPLPSPDEIEMVVADICLGKMVTVDKGKLYHYESCKEEEHKVTTKLRKALKHVQEETFKVAIYAGHKIINNGQPIVIVLDPDINYEVYPDHQHLGVAGRITSKAFIPGSLCYTANYKEFGEEDDIMLYNIFSQITIWLFRHQIWIATREIYGKGIWIGPQEGSLRPIDFFYGFNPNGICRCGSTKSYIDCHMISDAAVIFKFKPEDAKAYIDKHRDILIRDYLMKVSNPQKYALKKLTEQLIQVKSIG